MSLALPEVSSFAISASPPGASVNLIWMSGCEAFQTFTIFCMLGTQDQKVSVTFWFELEALGELLEEGQPATRAVAARAQAAAMAGRGNFIVHSCRGEGEGVTPGLRRLHCEGAVVNAPRFVTESRDVKW